MRTSADDNQLDLVSLAEFYCLKLVSADMTKALVCAINSEVSDGQSSVQKLFGDPDDYAYKLGNDTFADDLPIHMSRFYFTFYHFFHSISIDYKKQRVFYGNKAHERLEYGEFIHHNDSYSHYFGDVPADTSQVMKS